MPELSRFLGIVIAMYYREHGPAHFHAIYGDVEVTAEIETGRPGASMGIYHGALWPTPWNGKDLHKSELLDAWNLARASQPLPKIDPLE